MSESFEFDTTGHAKAACWTPTAITDDLLPDTDPGFLLNPITEAIIDDTNIDAMIDAYEEMKLFGDRLYAAQLAIRNKLADLTKGQTDAKTRRVQGNRRRVMIEMPSAGWDQSILKEAWNAYPDLRDQCLKIDTVGVKAREWKKLENTAGAPHLEAFRNMVKAAVKPPTGVPTVKIEQ